MAWITLWPAHETQYKRAGYYIYFTRDWNNRRGSECTETIVILDKLETHAPVLKSLQYDKFSTIKVEWALPQSSNNIDRKRKRKIRIEYRNDNDDDKENWRYKDVDIGRGRGMKCGIEEVDIEQNGVYIFQIKQFYKSL